MVMLCQSIHYIDCGLGLQWEQRLVVDFDKNLTIETTWSHNLCCSPTNTHKHNHCIKCLDRMVVLSKRIDQSGVKTKFGRKIPIVVYMLQ